MPHTKTQGHWLLSSREKILKDFYHIAVEALLVPPPKGIAMGNLSWKWPSGFRENVDRRWTLEALGILIAYLSALGSGELAKASKPKFVS